MICEQNIEKKIKRNKNSCINHATSFPTNHKAKMYKHLKSEISIAYQRILYVVHIAYLQIVNMHEQMLTYKLLI